LDFLVGNEPFQRVALTPSGKKTFVARIAAEKQPHIANSVWARRSDGIRRPRNRRGLDPIVHYQWIIARISVLRKLLFCRAPASARAQEVQYVEHSKPEDNARSDNSQHR
jgi:hypothetical protein